GARARAARAEAARLTRGLPRGALGALLYVPLMEAYLRPMLAQGFAPFRDRVEPPLFRRQMALLAHGLRGGI
ncbi:MAG: hypothetical protein HXY25_11065, partial [Alphaproteobacteria bacterium]|nr:hypothetical protein [Alphaproteobacteria bacterium]